MMKLIKNLKLKIKDHSRGASLLYAILVLGTITLISIAVAGLMIRGLKTSRAIGRGMAAYYAAETGMEEALYNVRVLDDTSDGNGTFLQVKGGWEYEVQDVFDPGNPYAQGLLRKDETIEFDDVNGSNQMSIDWSQDDDGVDAFLEVTYVGWEGDFANFLDGSRDVEKELLSSSANIALDAGRTYLVRFKPLMSAVVDFEVSFAGFTIGDHIRIASDGFHIDHKKILESNYSTDDNGVVSGFFDYVIFSNEALVK